MKISDERLAVMLEAIQPPVGAVVLKGDDLEAVRSVLAELIVLRPPLRKIHEAIADHIHPEPAMTKDQFIDAVLAAADDQNVVRAVRVSDASPER